MAESTPKKLRVLCLHGHRTNDKVMMNQTKGMRAAFGDDAEFIFLNAPSEARGETDPVILHHHGQDAPFYEWWAVRPVEPEDNYPTEDAEWPLIHEYFDESIEYMNHKLKELGPIDVVLGFSQGAVLLTILSMLYLQHYNQRPWKLCMCVGGVHVRAINQQHLFRTPSGSDLLVPFPSIHIIGENDPMHDESISLSEMYDNYPTAYPQSPLRKLVLYHTGNHKFPSATKHAKLYEDLVRIVKDHCRACDTPPAIAPAKL
jgi:hypothetical protein